MKNLFLVGSLIFISIVSGNAQQYQVVTTIESVVPLGLGRSRMISEKADVNVDDLTTQRTSGTDTDQGKVKRKDIKIDNLEETKMLNFFSATGINFQNIASNDAIISAKLSQMAADGWELAFVTSGVESDAGHSDGQGIFITRYIFKK